MAQFLGMLTIIFFFSMFFAVILQVVSRLIPFVPSFLWTEELSRTMFVMAVASAAPLAYRRGEFIIVDFLVNYFEERVNRILIVLITLLSAGFFIVLLFRGFFFVALGMDQMSATLRIPMAVPYASISFSAFFILYYLLITLIEQLSYWRRTN